MEETQTPPKEAPEQSQAASPLSGLEGFFDTYLRVKAPFQLPVGAKEFIVKYGPWITLVILILVAIVIVPLTLLALGLTAATAPYAVMSGYGGQSLMGFVYIGIGIAILVMEAIAIPKLMKRQISGWRLIYYASLLSALNSLLSLSILSLVIGLVVSMYILLQIREYYK